MDRVTFVESLQGINYPMMLVDFFDHIIALKNIVEDSGSVSVLETDENSIKFAIVFSSEKKFNMALSLITSLNGYINIYGRQLVIQIEVNPTDKTINIKLS